MKAVKILLGFALWLGTGVAIAAYIGNKKQDKTAILAGQGFAVVELFTSEGCSSCPAADAVVAKIEKESAGKPVYILAYHVDYWNRLGWRDAFSNAEFSRRQNTYADWFNLSSVYTPQVVVNGRTEFVGSQEGQLRKAISDGIAEAGKVQLSLSDIRINNNKASLNYDVQAASGNTSLVLTLVQKQATSAVKAGENKGRNLSHVQIVLKLQNIPLNRTSSGNAEIALPKNFSADNYELIAFVQDTKTGTVQAAARAALPASTNS
ncbi:DUF1223 domain-containing protein [Mucilaginibacter pedocola]|uniref:DUF1223 domain-containing protein n=1 Tax=Mucilaginibacter pedocola TaxID=1792845 RepID=A0A1S9P9H9_9SPHI|nr:DUF1223 domain-containing protein [Mucilaginibacter pedocola]OOQ57636.1 hypothetical protein BC343_12595 [Mucilaginibacter pedocola]